jgi:hypothetical protein
VSKQRKEKLSSKREQKEKEAAMAKQQAKLTQAQVTAAPPRTCHATFHSSLSQTLKAKEEGASGSKQRADKTPASPSALSTATAAAAAQQMPKENISFGNVAVDGKGLNDSKVKKVSCRCIARVKMVHRVLQVKADKRLLDKLTAKEVRWRRTCVSLK